MNWQPVASWFCVGGAIVWLLARQIIPLWKGQTHRCCSKGCGPEKMVTESQELQGLEFRPSHRGKGLPL